MSETENVDFTVLCIPIPEVVKTFDLEKQKNIFDYLSGLDEHEIKAYTIAYEHLGTSFSIDRSNGYKNWLESKQSH